MASPVYPTRRSTGAHSQSITIATCELAIGVSHLTRITPLWVRVRSCSSRSLRRLVATHGQTT